MSALVDAFEQTALLFVKPLQRLAVSAPARRFPKLKPVRMIS
jgi:hypothetical protein